MKKILKISGIVILSLIVLLLLAPFLFKGTIEDMVKKTINENVNATVAWEDLSLSLFSSFPDAQLTLENLSVINHAPFAGDTLVSSEAVSLDLGVMQLFNMGDGALNINEIAIHNALVNVKIDSLGNANYDIALESEPQTTSTDTSSSGLSFGIQHYEITNSQINYSDKSSNTFFQLKELNHEGTGDFSAKKSTLETASSALISFAMDDMQYLNELPIKLDANIEMDFENQKYSFLENEALINQLALTFDGFVKMNENNNEVDITFKTPSSSFKNLLAVIPEAYSKSIENVQTSGNFTVNGSIHGIVDEQHIPKMDISVQSKDAAFKYPDLPKKVKNISIDANLINKTGLAKDTYLTIGLLTFQIDEDIFTAHGSVKNLTENMLVDITAKGSVNLANIEKAYPLELEQDLNGILKADLSAKFDMNSVENERYQNIHTKGTASITNFKYASPEIPNEVKISSARLNFTSDKIQLEHLKATSGQTDAEISGTLANLMGFMFADQDIQGDFTLKSNTFALNDFMLPETEATQETDNTAKSEAKETAEETVEEAIKIPSFLDISLDFAANKVLYDDLVLNDVKGSLILKDETASLQNVSTSIFNGTIGVDGKVSTKTATPTFDMKLDLSSIDIGQSFAGLELLQNIAPIAKALKGTLNTNISLNGKLNNDLTPILSSLAGDALAQILSAKVSSEKMPLLSQLGGKLDFLNLDKINLNDLSTHLTFKDGSVQIQPFDFKVEGIDVTVAGKHSFDNTMDYTVTLDLPAKYLGSQLGGLVAKLSEADLKKMEVELPIGLTGTFTAPKIQVNTKKAVKDLTQRIVEEQKENLTEKATDALGNLLGGKETKKDSTNTQEAPASKEEKIKNAAEDILGGLFGRKKKDSTSTKKP